MANYNYKVTYTFVQCFPKIDSSKKRLKKATINLGFDDEPSEYEIESKTKNWVDELQRNVMSDIDCEIEFQEIVKFKKLKVTNGANDINLSNF
jgi:hypothetical protein